MAVKNMNYYNEDGDGKGNARGDDETPCDMWFGSTTEVSVAVSMAVRKYRSSKEQIDYLVTLDSVLLRYQEIVTQIVAEHGGQSQAIADKIRGLVVAGGHAVP